MLGEIIISAIDAGNKRGVKWRILGENVEFRGCVGKSNPSEMLVSLVSIISEIEGIFRFSKCLDSSDQK